VSLDPKIIEAVEAAAAEAGQPTALARRLVAWLEAVGDESEDINDIAATDRRLEIIYEAVSLQADDAGEEMDDSDDEGESG
jgi:hypothetical protein